MPSPGTSRRRVSTQKVRGGEKVGDSRYEATRANAPHSLLARTYASFFLCRRRMPLKAMLCVLSQGSEHGLPILSLSSIYLSSAVKE